MCRIWPPLLPRHPAAAPARPATAAPPDTKAAAPPGPVPGQTGAVPSLAAFFAVFFAARSPLSSFTGEKGLASGRGFCLGWYR